LPHIKDKRLIALAVASPERVAELPDVPTFKELGLEPVNRPALYGIWAPKGMACAAGVAAQCCRSQGVARPGGHQTHRGQRIARGGQQPVASLPRN
jgi:hypothetical protein